MYEKVAENKTVPEDIVWDEEKKTDEKKTEENKTANIPLSEGEGQGVRENNTDIKVRENKVNETIIEAKRLKADPENL